MSHRETCPRCQAQDAEEKIWAEREARERLNDAAPALLEAAEAALGEFTDFTADEDMSDWRLGVVKRLRTAIAAARDKA